jgi:hypothetical protein
LDGTSEGSLVCSSRLSSSDPHAVRHDEIGDDRCGVLSVEESAPSAICGSIE